MRKTQDIAAKLLGVPYETLDPPTQRVAQHIAERKHIARNLAREPAGTASFGQRAADAVASFGGSWVFVGLFAVSMLAAIQAPIILMSQNRQSEKDRLSAAHDYEVNLKAELKIMLLHEKIDLLRETQWTGLLEVQKEQLMLLQRLVEQSPSSR